MRQSEYSANVDLQRGARARQRTQRQVYKPEARSKWVAQLLGCLAFAVGFGAVLALMLT